MNAMPVGGMGAAVWRGVVGFEPAQPVTGGTSSHPEWAAAAFCHGHLREPLVPEAVFPPCPAIQ